MAMMTSAWTEDHPMYKTQITQEQAARMIPTMAMEVDPWSGA
ncbi:MAG TPA: hypothetical protein VGR28_03300 [Candidatus Thermoplasmatota archaeon]|jgi:hypothetical protein|nr:hypothetical protein [Candidatus Thermoplasmatota archaeon]